MGIPIWIRQHIYIGKTSWIIHKKQIWYWGRCDCLFKQLDKRLEVKIWYKTHETISAWMDFTAPFWSVLLAINDLCRYGKCYFWRFLNVNLQQVIPYPNLMADAVTSWYFTEYIVYRWLSARMQLRNILYIDGLVQECSNSVALSHRYISSYACWLYVQHSHA